MDVDFDGDGDLNMAARTMTLIGGSVAWLLVQSSTLAGQVQVAVAVKVHVYD